METNWLHPREELVNTMQRIYRYRMTTTSGGNLSILDPEGGIWITPSRVDKGSLTPSDIVCMMPDGSRIGHHPPSSEFPFHREIYRRRPDIKAIVHAHPGALVAFSICRILPDTRVQAHAFEVCGKVAYAPYACPGSEELGQKIAETFAAGADCVMLENHGVVIGGTDLKDAFQRFETLEFVAQTLVKAGPLGPIKALPEAFLQEQPMPALLSMPSAPPSNPERALRSQICDFIQRAYRQRLLISTAGAFSARLSEDEILVTPRRRDRLQLSPDRLLRARLGSTAEGKPACLVEEGQTPSRAALLHALILKHNPEVGAVINAQPAHASAFCMTEAQLSSRTIPESYIVLREVPRLPFACIVRDAEKIAAQVSLAKTPVVLIENEGALVLGRDLLDAFDRLEVLEATAEALLMSRPIGPLVPMPDAALDELRQVFKMD